MKFAYTIEQTIAIVSAAGYFDLHNCYELVSARQVGDECYVAFDKLSGSWVKPEEPAHLTLVFEQVTYFHVSEGLTFPVGVEFIGFKAPEDHDLEWFMLAPEGEQAHLLLGLDDDAFIRIGAGSSFCLIGQAMDR